MYLEGYINKLNRVTNLTTFTATKAVIKELLDSGLNISLCNNSQLYKLFDRCHEGPFAVIADESDVTAVNTKSSKSKRGVLIEQMLRHPNCVGSLRVSATIYAHLVVDDSIPVLCRNIHIIPDHPCHVSYGHKKFELVPTINNLHLSKNSYYSPAQQKEFYRIIKESRDRLRLLGHIPVLLLMVSRNVREHGYIKDLLEKKYKKDVITIVVNDSKIKVNNPDDELFQRKIDKIATLQEVMSIVHSSLQSIGNKPSKLVAIIGDAMLGRGQSPRNEIPNFTDYKQIMFASTAIVACANNTPIDTIIQKNFRIGGIFPGQDVRFPTLRVYTDANTIKNIDTIMQWNETCFEIIQDPANAERIAREILPPIPLTQFDIENKKDKLRKLSSKAPSAKRVQDLVFPTIESFENAMDKEHRNLNPLLKEGSTTRKILDLLTENADWMTRQEVYEMRPKEFWKLEHQQTPLHTIGSRLLELYEAGFIYRIKGEKRVFTYKVK